MNQVDIDITNEYIQYKVDYYSIEPRTQEIYRIGIERFSNFIEPNGFNLFTVTTEEVIRYKKSMANNTSSFVQLTFVVLNGLYKWMTSDTVQKLARNPIPQMRVAKVMKSDFVPTLDFLFKLRVSGRINTIERACYIEILASSGMRINEIQQIRPCDINWNPDIIDYSLGKQSPYIGCSIAVGNGTGIRSKRRRNRTVYVGKLASKLLRRYIDYMGMNDNDNVPIFVKDKRMVQRDMSWMAFHLLRKINEKECNGTIREAGHLDVDPKKVKNMKEEYRRRIEAIQRKRRRIKETRPSENAVGVNVVSKTKKSLHPHALRKLFACLMYYRNWYGNRHDVIGVRDLLGHSRTSITTDTYIINTIVCTTDDQWQRFMLGNGMDYKFTAYSFKANRS